MICNGLKKVKIMYGTNPKCLFLSHNFTENFRGSLIFEYIVSSFKKSYRQRKEENCFRGIAIKWGN